MDPSVASGARDEGSHLEIAGADREVEVSFNVLTRSGGVKRIGSIGANGTADKRMGRSRVGSKCCGVGWVRRKTTRHGTAKLTHGQAPCRFSALFASRGFFRRVLSSTHLSKERPLNGLSKMSRLNRMSIASRGLNWIRSLRRAPGDASARPAPVREAVPQNRLAISPYDSIFLESKGTIGTLSIGQVDSSVVAGVGLTSGSHLLPPRYGIYGSKHSAKGKATNGPRETIAGSDHQ